MMRVLPALLVFVSSGTGCESPVDTSAAGSSSAVTTIASTGGAAADAGVRTSPGARPGPSPRVVIRVLNKTAEDRFLGGSTAGYTHPALERFDGSSWQKVIHQAPPCMAACPSRAGAKPSCVHCAPPNPQARRIPSGGDMVAFWDGRLFDVRAATDPGSCSCFRARAAPAGRYRVSVCVHDEVSCPKRGWCPAVDAGADIYGIEASSATPICSHTELDFTGEAQTIEVEITK